MYLLLTPGLVFRKTAVKYTGRVQCMSTCKEHPDIYNLALVVFVTCFVIPHRCVTFVQPSFNGLILVYLFCPSGSRKCKGFL